VVAHHRRAVVAHHHPAVAQVRVMTPQVPETATVTATVTVSAMVAIPFPVSASSSPPFSRLPKAMMNQRVIILRHQMDLCGLPLDEDRLAGTLI
jgi:hypothetical protein